MEESYFLGANSRAGFASLYRHFAAAPGDTLHVIKGGPGTGKSGLMRSIAAAAKERGFDVETVLCSGDPDSLDGVYIPALRQGWVDGTAPHTLDPAHFGADGDYADLGRFCRLPLKDADRARALERYRAYQGRYAAAYRWLAAAGAAYDAAPTAALPEEAEKKLRRRIRGILQRLAPRGAGGAEKARFLSAISCRGELKLELPERYATVYRLDEGRGLAPKALRIAAEEAAARGLGRILCPSPLCPTELEGLLLPEAGIAFLTGERRAETERSIHLDALLPPPEREEKLARRRASQLQRSALEAAVEQLRLAKARHDELEAVYRPYMDFAALTEFTEQTVRALFA